MSSEGKDEFTQWYLQTQEGIAHSSFSDPAARVLDVLSKISFLIERKEARVPVLQALVAAAKVHKGNLSRHLNELETSDAIKQWEDNGWYYFRIQPDWKMWRSRRRYTYAEEALMERALKLLIEIGKSDPEQIEFGLREFERAGEFEGEVSRAFAGVGSNGRLTPPRKARSWSYSVRLRGSRNMHD